MKEAASGRVSRSERAFLRETAFLQAAEQLFAEKGFDAATMTEVASRAGYGIATLYGCFATKEELAVAVNRRMTEIITAHLDALRVSRDWDDIADLGARLFDLFRTLRAEVPAMAALADRPEADSKLLKARVIVKLVELLQAASPGTGHAKLETTALAFSAISRSVRFLGDEPDIPMREEAFAQLRRVTQRHLAEELRPG